MAKFKKKSVHGVHSHLKFLENLRCVFKGVLRGHIVATVTYNVKKMMTRCSPMIEQFFDTMIVASSDKEWL